MQTARRSTFGSAPLDLRTTAPDRSPSHRGFQHPRPHSSTHQSPHQNYPTASVPGQSRRSKPFALDSLAPTRVQTPLPPSSYQRPPFRQKSQSSGTPTEIQPRMTRILNPDLKSASSAVSFHLPRSTCRFFSVRQCRALPSVVEEDNEV